MKRISTILTIVLLASTGVWAQENILTITGGYAFANLEEAEVDASGYRINATYEFNANEGKFSHGLSIGYISASADSAGAQGAEYKMNTWPIYYAPRLMFGSGKVRAFVKGALGMHLSGYKRTGVGAEISTNDTGFFGGASVGAMINLKENVFLLAEYEWAYMSNSYFQNGFMNTANFGLGFRF